MLASDSQSPTTTTTSNVETAPQASFDFDFDATTDVVTITHTAGDAIEADHLYVRGDAIAQGDAGATWAELGGPDATDDGEVMAGRTIEVDVTGADYVIRVIWEGDEVSSTMQVDEGPEA